MTQAVGYVRVSTREQGDNGHGLAAQESAIREACQRRSYHLVTIYQDVVSSRKAFRPGLVDAMVRARELGGVLVAWRQSRISRSTREMLALWDQAEAEGWQIVPLDLPDLAPGSSGAKLYRTIMAAMAEHERNQISEATKEGMAAAKVNGTRSGRSIGRPTAFNADKRPDERERAEIALPRLLALREAGVTFEKIAETLNAEGIRSFRDGRWHKRSVVRAWQTYGEG